MDYPGIFILARVQRAHLALLALSTAVLLSAVAGSHGWFL